MTGHDLFAVTEPAWSVTALTFTRDRKGTRVGFTTIRLDPPGLVIRRVPVLAKGGTRWVTLPAAPRLKEGGHPWRDEHGKIVYEALFAFADEAALAAFRDAVLAGVLTLDPNAFDPDGNP